jgi:hypothetical protein
MEEALLLHVPLAFFAEYCVYKCRRPEGKRPPLRWEDNIKMDIREISWDSVEWIFLF